MSILQQQLRICLAAILVAGLLLAGIVFGKAATPCNDHHGGPAVSAQLGAVEHAGAAPAAADDPVPCCSTAAASCCPNAAINCDGAIALSPSPARSAWLAANPSTLHGLGNKVNRHPPRRA